jgi:putative ABC transport system permease protein
MESFELTVGPYTYTARADGPADGDLVLLLHGFPETSYEWHAQLAAPGATSETNDALPTAISLGGTEEVSTKIPSDALEASAQADETLQQTALFAGILALAVGGLGIANVMSISVIQRSSEIGIRRALGTTRSLIALQFLLEALFVGILGGVIGAFVGVGVVYLVSGLADWVVVIDYSRMPLWIGLAVGVSVIAGLYPSVKAARLEPLETLRLG